MSDSRDNSVIGFLAGAMIGGAVGAVAALLLAPKTGREMRGELADRSEDMFDKAKDYFNEATDDEDEIEDEFVNEGRMKAERIVSSAREQAQTLLSNAEQVLTDARSRSKKVKAKTDTASSKVADAAKAGADAFRSEIK